MKETFSNPQIERDKRVYDSMWSQVQDDEELTLREISRRMKSILWEDSCMLQINN